MLKKRYQLAVVTAALALLLTGCTGGNGSSSEPATAETQQSQSSAPEAASDQSKADACKIVQDSFTEFGQVSSSIDASDPQAALASFKELSAKAGDSLNRITNTEVKPAATKAASALDAYVSFLETVISDPSKANDLSGQVTALQEGFTEAATVCAS